MSVPENNLIPFIMTFAPALVYAYVVYRSFKRTASLKVSFLYFLMGALSVTAVMAFHWILPWWTQVWHGDFVTAAAIFAFYQVALVEESVKLLFYRFTDMYRKRLPGLFGTMFYTMSVSLGFAVVENMTYAWQMGDDVLATRAVSAVILHLMSGLMMGYFITIGRYRDQRLYWSLALIVPTLFHGLYDFNIMVQNMVTPFGMVIPTGLGIPLGWTLIGGGIMVYMMYRHVYRIRKKLLED